MSLLIEGQTWSETSSKCPYACSISRLIGTENEYISSMDYNCYKSRDMFFKQVYLGSPTLICAPF